MTARGATRAALAAMFAVAGVLHFALTDAFAAIVPAVVPAPRAVVLATGVLELAFAAAILVPSMRRGAGVLLALYCLAVLPANVTMALDPALGLGLPPAVLWARVALQLPLIALIVWATRKP